MSTTLTRNDIILGAEAEIIRQALEARIEIDRLLLERAKAYELIASLEEQVDEILGDAQAFPFPEPELPIFGLTRKPGAAKKSAAKPKPAPKVEKIEVSVAGDDVATQAPASQTPDISEASDVTE